MVLRENRLAKGGKDGRDERGVGLGVGSSCIPFDSHDQTKVEEWSVADEVITGRSVTCA